MSLPSFIEPLRRQGRQVFDHVVNLRDTPEIDCWILGCPNVARVAQNLTSVAIMHQNAQNAGFQIKGSCQALPILSGSTPAKNYHLGDLKVVRRRRAPKSVLPLRNIKATAKINSWKFPLAYTNNAPRSFAISSMMENCRTERKTALQFGYIESLIGKELEAEAPYIPGDTVAEQTEDLIHTLSSVPELTEENQAALRSAMGPAIRRNMAIAEHDLRAVSKKTSLPQEVWISPGGVYAQRLLSQVIRARGGVADIMMHAGPIELLSSFDLSDIMIESIVGTHNTWATSEAVDVARENGFLARTRSIRQIQYRTLSGDPTFSPNYTNQKNTASMRPKVLYLATIFLSGEQILPGHAPDGLHFDWQLMVARALRTLPLDLTVRPHPDGRAEGYNDYLEMIGAKSVGSLQEALNNADVVVSDNIRSTTFLQAACSDAALVYVNNYNEAFSPSLDATLRDRCNIVEPGLEEAGRPVLDINALADAIFSRKDYSESQDRLVKIFAGKRRRQ